MKVLRRHPALCTRAECVRTAYVQPLPRPGAPEVTEAPATAKEQESSPEERQERRRRWTLDWAALLKKTFGVDVRIDQMSGLLGCAAG
jgi:hypothetical protein